MTTYDPRRREFFREYMRKRRAAKKEGTPVVFKMPMAPRIRDANWRKRQQMKAFAAQASVDAARYYQPSLISFLPESPRLEMEWRHVLAAVQAERGTQWQTVSWAQQ